MVSRYAALVVIGLATTVGGVAEANENAEFVSFSEKDFITGKTEKYIYLAVKSEEDSAVTLYIQDGKWRLVNTGFLGWVDTLGRDWISIKFRGNAMRNAKGPTYVPRFDMYRIANTRGVFLQDDATARYVKQVLASTKFAVEVEGGHEYTFMITGPDAAKARKAFARW